MPPPKKYAHKWEILFKMDASESDFMCSLWEINYPSYN